MVSPRAYSLNIVVVAAGNNGLFDTSPRNPNFIVVNGVDPALQRAGFSNEGRNIDLCAPAVDIAASDINGRLVRVSGTSYAATQVAGVVALMRSANGGYTNRQIEGILYATAKRLGGGTYSPRFGFGLPDAFRAVQAVKLGIQ